MSFPEQPFGFVAGRWVRSIGDTPDDADRAPDYIPVETGTVVFTPQVTHRVAPDATGWAGIIKERIPARLGERGQLIDAEGHDHLALAVGVYSVSYDFGSGRSWPSHYIEVRTDHTTSSPLWLPPIAPPPVGPMIENRVVTVPADGADGQVLVWDGAGFSWEDSPPGLQGPQGDKGERGERGPIGPQGPAIDINTGLPIQIDTTVGTRIFIGGHMVHGDTGWRNISGLLINGWVGDSIILRRIGAQVTLQNNNSVGIPFSGLGSTSTIFMKAPNGFRPSPVNGYFQIGSLYSGDKVTAISSESVEGISSTDRETINLRGMVTWITSDPWPTTLPGTPG